MNELEAGVECGRASLYSQHSEAEARGLGFQVCPKALSILPMTQQPKRLKNEEHVSFFKNRIQKIIEKMNFL